MIYTLAGVASLGGPSLKTSAFLIPYFRSDSSTRMFAQELNEDFRIVDFRPFNPINYGVIDHRCSPLERSLGDTAVMAFFCPETSVVVGDVKEVVRQLQESRLPVGGAPFFEIDVCYLTGDLVKVRGAIRRAAKMFSNGAVAKRWALTENNMATRQQQSRIALEEKAQVAVTRKVTGTVKWFNIQKGFGFIQPDNGGGDVFVHISAVERAGLNGLNEGQKVSFDLDSERGKDAAVNLKG